MLQRVKSKVKRHWSMSATAPGDPNSPLAMPRNKTLAQIFKLGQTPICESAFGTAVEVVMMLNVSRWKMDKWPSGWITLLTAVLCRVWKMTRATRRLVMNSSRL